MTAIDALLAQHARGAPAPRDDYPGDHVLPIRPRASAAPAPPNMDAEPTASPASGGPDRAPRLTRLADVQPVEVRWLWQDRIPQGRITVLAGRPGCGKSMLSIDWAARVSQGRDWPDGTCCPRGSVLMLSAEDGLDDTVRPRLDAARADVSRIVALEGVRHHDADGTHHDRAMTLADLPMLEAALDTMPDCRLILIDPIGSYLGGDVDAHRDTEIRARLAPVAAIAAARDIAVVVVAHLRKGGAATHADDAILGSIAFAGIARSVLHVLDDPDDPERKRKILAPGKSNLAPRASGWSLRVEGRPPRIVWLDRVDQSADDVVQAASRPGPAPAAKTEAADWLHTALAAGPRPSKDIITEAREAAGITEATLRRAREAAEVEAYRPKIPGAWWWRLPGPVQDAQVQDAQPPKGGEPEHLEHLEHLASVQPNSEGPQGQHTQDDQDPLSPESDEHLGPAKAKRKRRRRT